MHKKNLQAGLASVIVVLVGVLVIAGIVGAGYWYAHKYFINVNGVVIDQSMPVAPKEAAPAGLLPVEATGNSNAPSLTASSTSAASTSTLQIVPTTSLRSSPSSTLKALLTLAPDLKCNVTNIVNGTIAGGRPGAGSVFTKGNDFVISYTVSDLPTTRILKKGDLAYVSTEKKDQWVGVQMNASQLDGYLTGNVDLPGFAPLTTPISYDCEPKILSEGEYKGFFKVPDYVKYTDISTSSQQI